MMAHLTSPEISVRMLEHSPGFPPGTVVGQINVANSASASAATDVANAYAALSGKTCGMVLGTTMGSGQILTPNIYCLGAASTLNGSLTLNGQGNANSVLFSRLTEHLRPAQQLTLY
ncbi:MAG: DUF3494 domain-containing protein [Saprospiraceae bacterium]|nr:DUF3494 domain-containing protein [Saprospiraceae bacterium]